jgi:hypothetical protein
MSEHCSIGYQLRRDGAETSRRRMRLVSPARLGRLFLGTLHVWLIATGHAGLRDGKQCKLLIYEIPGNL